jgi:hypothetical protein
VPHTRGNHHEAPYPYPRERHGRRHPAGAQRRWAAKKAIFKVYVGVLYQQVSKGEQALNQAFSPPPPTEQKVLFYLPVTKAWLSQVVLALVLLCHSSFRGVVEFFREVLDGPVALGSVHTNLRQAVAQVRQLNAVEDLSAVRAGDHDEIFQSGQPVLVGVNRDST